MLVLHLLLKFLLFVLVTPPRPCSPSLMETQMISLESPEPDVSKIHVKADVDECTSNIAIRALKYNHPASTSEQIQQVSKDEPMVDVTRNQRIKDNIDSDSNISECNIFDKPMTPSSSIHDTKRKRLRVLSSSSEEDEPLVLRKKNRRTSINVSQKKRTNFKDKIKPCSIVTDSLSVPDEYTYGALLKRHHSRNSRHPYTIRKWLKTNKKLNLTKRRISPQSLMILDATEENKEHTIPISKDMINLADNEGKSH